MGFYQLKWQQYINTTVDELWDFISAPQNLKEITPGNMGFEITSGGIPGVMYPGMIVAYTVRPLMGIKTRWITEITQVHQKSYFVDEQRVGPYALWHHEHHIERAENGVLMIDILSYKPPLGVLGNLANTLFIRRRLMKIFGFRREAIERKYGKYRTS